MLSLDFFYKYVLIREQVMSNNEILKSLRKKEDPSKNICS